MTASGLFTLYGVETFQTFEPDKNFSLFGLESLQTFPADRNFSLFGIEVLQSGVFYPSYSSNISLYISGADSSNPTSNSGIPLYLYGLATSQTGIPLYTSGPCSTGYYLRDTYLITSDSFNREHNTNLGDTDAYLGGRILPWQEYNVIVSGDVVQKNTPNITASGSQALVWSNSYNFVDLRCTLNTYPGNSVGLLARARPQGGQFRDGILYTINTVVEDGFPLTRGRIYKRTADNSLTASFSLLSAGSEISDIPITGYMRMVASGNNIIGYYNDTPVAEYNSISNPNTVYNLIPNTGIGVYVNNINFTPSEEVYVDNFIAYGDEYLTYESNCFNNDIPLYIGGLDTANTGIPLFISSFDTQNSGFPLYVSGIPVSNSGMPLYTIGHIANNSGTPLYTFGVFTNNSGIPLYIQNAETQTSGIPLFVNGVFTNTSGIPLYVRGKTGNNDNVPLYISSFTGSGNSHIALYIGSLGDRIEKGMPLYLKNPGSFSGLELVIWGEGYSTNPDTGEGYIPSQGNIHLYIEGLGTKNELPLYINSNEGFDNNNLNLYIPAAEVANTGIPMFIDSIDSKNDNLTLYSHGF